MFLCAFDLPRPLETEVAAARWHWYLRDRGRLDAGAVHLTSGITAPLAAHGLHLLLGIALAGGRSARHGLLDEGEVVLGERYISGTRVVFEVLAALGPWDGYDIAPLGEQPREGELPRGDALAFGDLAHPVRKLQVLLEVLLREAWEAGAAGVVLGHVVDAPPASGEEATPERAVGDEPDAQLAHGRQDLVLHVPSKERILRLEGADGVHGVGLPDGLWSRLGEPEVANLAGLHKLLHRADRLVDGCLRVHAVLVVDVYVIHAEARERSVAGRPHVVWLTAHAAEAHVLAAHVAEIGGEHDLVAPALDGPADELLVGEGAVHVGRVEEGYAELYRPMNGGRRLVFVAVAVELAHAHAPEPEVRHYETFAT